MAKYNINTNILVNKIGLEGGDNDRLVLHQILMKDGSKTYIKDISIKYDGKVIVKNYRDSIPFLITLKSFTKRNFLHGDENRYFMCVDKEDKEKNSSRSDSNNNRNRNHKIIRSLNCKFDTKRYISLNEASIIIDYIEKSTLGRSTIKLNIGKTVLDINGIRFMLDDNNKIYPLDLLSDTLDYKLKKLGVDTKNMSDDDKLSSYIEHI